MNPLVDDIRVTVVIDSIEYVDSSNSAYNFSIDVRLPGEGAGGMQAEPTTILAINNKQVGRVWVENRLQTAAGPRVEVFCVWSHTVNGFTVAGRTAFEPPITTDGGAGRFALYDQGAKGVPLGAQFKIGALNSEGFEFIADEWFTYSGKETAAVNYTLFLDGLAFRFHGVVPTTSGTPIDLAKNLSLSERSFTFGLAADDRFAIEGSIVRTNSSYQTGPNPNDRWNWWTSDHLITPEELYYSSEALAWDDVDLGGLGGERAFQEGLDGSSPTQLRSIFSGTQLGDKFIEDYYFQELVFGQNVKISFYYIVG